MKAPFKYTPEVSGIAITGVLAITVIAIMGGGWEYIADCFEFIAFDIALCASFQWLHWRLE